MILANLNLVVPIIAAVLVIIVAIIVLCVLRRGRYHKGKYLFFVRFRHDRAGKGLARRQDAVPVDPRLGRFEHHRADHSDRCGCRCWHCCCLCRTLT